MDGRIAGPGMTEESRIVSPLKGTRDVIMLSPMAIASRLLRFGFAALVLGLLALAWPGTAEAQDHGGHGQHMAVDHDTAPPAHHPEGNSDPASCPDMGAGCCCVSASCHTPVTFDRSLTVRRIASSHAVDMPMDEAWRALAQVDPPPEPPRA